MKNIMNVYSGSNEKDKEKFSHGINSSLQVKSNSNKNSYDDEWLCKMEECIRYLDNILRNPNRFIVNEEDIVKVELARRITVESIKHLSRNTNFIQDYDKKTGNVRPSKILNINKEESFNTYENRFIFSLINNMKTYVEKKKNEEICSSSSNVASEFVYQGKSKIENDEVSISVNLNRKLSSDKSGAANGEDIQTRITKLEERIRDLCSSDVYKKLTKLHVAMVTSPIKKTNLILKNTNFQYALDLWNYMQANMEASAKNVSSKQDYVDNGELRDLMDQSFYINYLIIKSLTDEEITEQEKQEYAEKTAENMVEHLTNLNNDLSLEDMIRLVGDQYVKVKYKKVGDYSVIERIYKQAIKEYTEKVDELKVK